MKVHAAGSRRRITYEVGDHVRLLRDEPGGTPTAFAGEWGEVEEVSTGHHGQCLDIRLAGFSRPRGAPIEAVRRYPAPFVVPTDPDGRLWIDRRQVAPRRLPPRLQPAPARPRRRPGWATSWVPIWIGVAGIAAAALLALIR